MTMIEKVARAICTDQQNCCGTCPGVLRTARAAIEAMLGWQPIETAPREIISREKLLFGDVYHERGRHILAAGGNCYRARVVRWWQTSDDPRRYCNFLGDCGNAFYPTHWMPLPDPPAEGPVAVSADAKPPLLVLLSALTDEQRMDLFGNFCRACGSPDPGCQCWNDE